MEPRKPPMYLQRRNGVYYFRRRIPDTIKDLLTKEEKFAFLHSLETKERHAALAALPGRIARAEAIIERVSRRTASSGMEEASSSGSLRRTPKRSKTFYLFNESAVTSLCNRWLREELEHEKEQALEVYVHWDEESRKERIWELSDDLHHLLTKQGSEVTDQMVYIQVERVLAEADCEPPAE